MQFFNPRQNRVFDNKGNGTLNHFVRVTDGVPGRGGRFVLGGNLLVAIGSEYEGKPMLTVMLGEELVKTGLNAGAMVREAAKLIQGGGGGQPHFATAGGKNPDGLSAAVDKLLELATKK